MMVRAVNAARSGVRSVAFGLFLLSSLSGLANETADPNADFNDGIDRNDPKFVTASLLVIGPGNELFSCVGHSALRLECPIFKHDYCFTYESERAVERLPAFFAGKLKMGLFTFKTGDMLSEYSKEGRGIRQYTLNLPPDVKQRLWECLDQLAMKGADLPYDYMKRGCAKSVLDCLKAAFAPKPIKGPMLPITQRETFNRELAETHPWNLFFLNAIVGTETDTFTEVVTPKNLLHYLRAATVDGVPLLTDPGRELLPPTLTFERRIVSPLVAAWIVFALTVAACLLHKQWIFWTILSAQALAGCFFIFLVAASHLPNSGWNWLLVPFNPVVPAAVWFRRMRCSPLRREGLTAIIGWASVLVPLGWVMFMLLAPHAKTDPAYLVLAGSVALAAAAACGIGSAPYSALRRMVKNLS